MGVGCGCVYTAAVSSSATSGDPNRLYAWGTLGSNILFAILLFFLPLTMVYGYHKGVYLTLFFVISGTCWILKYLPVSAHAVEQGKKNMTTTASVNRLVIVSMSIGFFLINMGMGSVWPFMERIGTDVGIGNETIGMTLSVSTIAMMAGAGLAGITGVKYGRTTPIAIGYFGSALACIVILVAFNPLSFVLGGITWGLFYLFVYPYFIGIPAAIDTSGRLAVAIGGMCVLSYALGSTVGGYVAGRYGYASVGWLGFSSCFIAYMLTLPVCLLLDKRQVIKAVVQ